MESLPTELILELAFHFSSSHLATLSQVSRALNRRIEPVLFSRPDVQNKVMRWACTHGDVNLVNKAIGYGASVSTVELSLAIEKRRTNHRGHVAAPSVKILTLHLATKLGGLKTFVRLVQLGARVDQGGVYRPQVRALLRQLCHVSNLDFLKSFLEAGIGLQLPRPTMNRMLIHLIQAGVCSDLIEPLIKNGADANAAVIDRCLGSWTFTSPLSAALLSQTKSSVFERLLQNGARIDGPRIFGPTGKPLHIPIFAAVTLMHQNGTGAVEMCLEHGASLQQCSVAILDFRNCYVCTMTPLVAYLDSIETWKSQTALSVLDGLEYLLERGASVDVSFDHQPTKRSWIHEQPTTIDLLFKKWGLESLVLSDFFSTVRLLVQRGAAQKHTSKLLSRYEYLPNDGLSHDGDESGCSIAVIIAWQSFIDLLLSNAAEAQTATDLLHEYIQDKADPAATFGPFTTITIDHLLAHGAQINELKAIGADKLTPLHELCWGWQIFEMTWEDQSLHPGLYAGGGAENRQRFIQLLLSRGADPNIKTADDMTAGDILLQEIDSYSEEGKEFIETIVEEFDNARLVGDFRPTFTCK